jgi:AcrR family transcriptional regulator
MIVAMANQLTTTPRTAGGAATRERLLEAAMNLFGRHGYKATSVGAIEQAAGLAPRSGALYQYFAGKEELLVAALERRMESLTNLQAALELMPLGDLRAELRLLARWNLASLRDRAGMTTFLARDGEHVPGAIRAKLYTELVEQPYSHVVAWVQQRIGQVSPDVDVYALTLILVESMSAYVGLRSTFDRAPDGIDDDRYVEAWVALAADTIERARASPARMRRALAERSKAGDDRPDPRPAARRP